MKQQAIETVVQVDNIIPFKNPKDEKKHEAFLTYRHNKRLQIVFGLVLSVIAIISSIMDVNPLPCLLLIPLGVFMIFNKKIVMLFKGCKPMVDPYE